GALPTTRNPALPPFRNTPTNYAHSAARQCVQQARKRGLPQRAEEDVIAENARLRRENQELRDTNELLKAASAFFASELDPKRRK
ncbi:hypothetical protein QP172_11725, partial [Corynebacterium coyleae]|uniref:hypothetical protein n=1 Tax=Corynebacterium coyleae TaxID=53374 RepID=UPI00254CC620